MMSGNVLVVDDEDKLRGLLIRVISLEGYSVYVASNLKSAARILDMEDIDVVVCDLMLPDGNGVDFTKTIKSRYPRTEIILLTAHVNIPDFVQAMRSGAFDYIIKGDDNEKLLPLIAIAVERAHLKKRVAQLEEQFVHVFSFDNIVGQSAAIRGTTALAKKVTFSDTTVLLLGETGTGKEIVRQSDPRQ